MINKFLLMNVLDLKATVQYISKLLFIIYEKIFIDIEEEKIAIDFCKLVKV